MIMTELNKQLDELPHKLRILIVDDSFLMRQVIASIIESSPYLEVAGEAVDGNDALEKARELVPDVILLDIEMPNMDGIEFVRQSKLVTDAKIIIISSVAQIGSPQALEALELGVADIIPKPSGVLSIDLEQEKSEELLEAIYRCVVWVEGAQ